LTNKGDQQILNAQNLPEKHHHARGNDAGTRQNLINALVSKKIDDTNFHLNRGIVCDHEAAPGTRKHRPSWVITTEHDATARWTLVGSAPTCAVHHIAWRATR
jgi:hypothetical protein